jgi:hypothetical protein
VLTDSLSKLATSVTLIIVFIGSICYYYFCVIGAVLGTFVATSSLSKSRANVLLPLLALIGSSWVAGEVVASRTGAIAGIALATTWALWLEGGRKFRQNAAIDKR